MLMGKLRTKFVYFLIVAIDGLPNDSNGQPPNPFVVVYIIIPPQQQTWLQHNHTEMVEVSKSSPSSPRPAL